MKNGFSLIELMIVVSIVGILAAIAIPNFVKFQCRTHAKKLQMDNSICDTSEGRQKVRDGVIDPDYQNIDTVEDTEPEPTYCTTPKQYEALTNLHLSCQKELDKYKNTNCAVCEDQLSQCRAHGDLWSR